METELILFRCARCDKQLKFPEELNYFGARLNFPEMFEGKKVYCREHFEDLKIFLKRKRQEEVIPLLQEQAQQLLQVCEKNRKKFIEIVKQTKRFITSLNKLNFEEIENSDFEKQAELNLNGEIINKKF